VRNEIDIFFGKSWSEKNAKYRLRFVQLVCMCAGKELPAGNVVRIRCADAMAQFLRRLLYFSQRYLKHNSCG